MRFSALVAAALVAGPAVAQVDPSAPPLLNGQETRNRATTEIHFLAYRGEETYVVSVGEQSCTTPCTLLLHPGPTKIHLVGPGEADIQIVVPHLAAQVRVMTGPPSWYLPTGVVLVPGGAIIGTTMWTLAFACGSSGGCVAVNAIAWPVIGIAMIVTGAVLLGQYAKSQPLDANRPEILDARRERAPGFRFEGLSLAPIRGGFSGGLAFSF